MNRITSRLRGPVARLALVVLGVVVTLGLLEGAFRWFRWHRLTYVPLGEFAEELSVRDPRYHHRYAPNARVTDRKADYTAVYTTNRLGIRGTRDYGPKPPGVRRLLMLGDSFTFGIGVQDEETFCARLERRLQAQGRRVEVVNAGVGSYSPILHYLTLRDLYLPLEPDAVILWLDFGDIQDDDQYKRHLLYDDAGQPVACHADYVNGRRDWWGGLVKRSAMVKYFHRKLVRSYEKLRALGPAAYLRAKLRGEDTKLLAVHMEGIRRQRADLVRYDRHLMIRGLATDEELSRYWRLTGTYVLAIRDLLCARQIPFLLGTYPYGVQVGANQRAEGRVFRMFEKGISYEDPRPFAFIEDFGRQHGIPVITTYPSFLAARDVPLFFAWDAHFSPAGHQVVADHLLRDPVFVAWLNGATQEAGEAAVGG